MSLIHSAAPGLIPPRDDLTVPQFMLDYPGQHPTQPTRPQHVPCLIDDKSARSISLEELRSRTHGLANSLHLRWGVKNNDVVSIFSCSHIDYPVCVWAAHRLGAIVAPINPALTVDELAFLLRVVKPTVLITHVTSYSIAIKASNSIGLLPDRIIVIDVDQSSPLTSLASTISYGLRLPTAFEEPVLKPGDAKTKVAFLSCSSGTTGMPKAVEISHFNVICNVVQVATFNRINEDYAPHEEKRFRVGDVASGVLPLYHIYGIVTNLHFILYAGMTLVVTQKFQFEEMLKNIAQYSITHLFVVPPQLMLFCKHPAVPKYDLTSVRYCMVAAAPLSAELTQRMIDVMPNIHLGQGYGMTETCGAVSLWPLSQRIGTMGSVGQLVSGVCVKIVKEDGTLACRGEPGELYVLGDQNALRYHDNDEATKETFTDGWVRTGDEVLIDEMGDLFVVDRIKELLKVKGNQVAPAELEAHLLSHADVADAGVVGVHDEFAGELPLAFIVLRPDVARTVAADRAAADRVKASIKKHVSDAKINYKWLAGGVEFIDAIPKSPIGKILRRTLREHAKSLYTVTPQSKL